MNLPAGAGGFDPAGRSPGTTDMDLHHHVTTAWRARDIRRRLARLDDRQLADIGVDRDGIASFADDAARGVAGGSHHAAAPATSLLGRALGLRAV